MSQGTVEAPTGDGAYLVDYNQPETSPYKSDAIDLLIGEQNSKYTIHRGYILPYPKLKAAIQESYRGNDVLTISICKDDIGHTLVRYLYTGEYETLKLAIASPPENFIYKTEYRRSLQVYCIARKYDIHGLRALAKRYVRVFAAKITLFEIIRIIRELYPRIHGDEGQWLLQYTKARLEEAFDEDENIFNHPQLVQAIGGSGTFEQLLMRMVIGVYSTKLKDMRVAQNGGVEEGHKDGEKGVEGATAKGEGSEDVKEKTSGNKEKQTGGKPLEAVENAKQVNGVDGSAKSDA